MGVQTGVDLQALLGCARRVRELLGRPLGSHTLLAGPVDWHSSD
jgi:hydroxymethylglutaryl-CoA lyase